MLPPSGPERRYDEGRTPTPPWLVLLAALLALLVWAVMR